MKLYETTIQEETAQLPTELDQLQILTAREFSNKSNNHFKLKLLKAGLAGEDKVIATLEEFGKNTWTVMRNVWIHFSNTFEYDIILITDYCVYIFEVKNFTGKFGYENGVCILNNQKMDNDVIQQTRRNLLRMRRLCGNLPIPPRVKGVLVFAGENNKVEINSPTEDIEAISSTDLYELIKNIIEEEENHVNSNYVNAEQVIYHLEQHEVAHPYLAESIPKSKIQNLRRGIHCARCGNRDLIQTKHYLACSCGYHESREEAIVRTICDYGVLTHNEDFTLGEIMTFIDYQASDAFLRDILVKHFKQNWNGRYTSYENKKLPYYKIFFEFEFDYPAILYTKRSKPDVIVFN